MNSLTAVMVLMATVTARPDGPGGAGHHATHGAHHEPITTVNLGSSHPVHTVHSVQPVHSSFSIQPESVHQQNVVAPVVVKSSPKTIADLVSTNPKFSTLHTAVKAAGLEDTLAGAGPFTVFAPTNAAFDKVPVDSLNKLMGNKEELKKVLERHILPGVRLEGKEVPDGSTKLTSASGDELRTERE